MDRDQDKNKPQQANQSSEQQDNLPKTVFDNSRQEDKNSKVNKEQEAALEQERKEALTERE